MNDLEMLRSILKKDNERLETKIEGSSAEPVFILNWEGGGTEITRYTTANGEQFFRRSGGGMDLDDNDDEVWNHYDGDPSVSFEEELFFLGFGKDILALRPSLIHPDYRARMREYIEKLLDEVNVDDRLRLGDLLPRNVDDWFERVR